MNNSRFQREIDHGKYLAESEAEVRWGWGSPAGKVRMQRRAKLIADSVSLRAGMRVLEIGCGTGLFTEPFAKTGCRLTAVDLSPELIGLAKERLKDYPNVDFEQKPFEDCLGMEHFDAIVGSSVLHHLDIAEAIKIMFKLLKPGGSLGFAEPNHMNPQIFAERKFRKYFPQVSPDETAFYRLSFAAMLRKVGYVDVRVVPFDWLHPVTPSKLIPFVSGVGRVFEKFPIVREFSGSLLIRASKP